MQNTSNNKILTDYQTLTQWLTDNVYTKAGVIHSIKLRNEKELNTAGYQLFFNYLTKFALTKPCELDKMIKLQLTGVPACPICETVSNTLLRHKYCSNKCAQLSPEVQAIKQQNAIQKYGVNSANRSAEAIERRRATTMSRTDEQKAASKLKTQQTSQLRYGVDSPNQAPSVTEKKKQAYAAKGGSWSFTVPGALEKTKATNLARYGVENLFQDTEYIKSKVLEKHGVPYTALIPEVRERQKATCIETYGVYPASRAPQIANQIKQTKAAVTDEEQAIITEKRLQTNIERYGVAHPVALPDKIAQRWISHATGYYDTFIDALRVKRITLMSDASQYVTKAPTDCLSYLCNRCSVEFTTDRTSPQRITCVRCAEIMWQSGGERDMAAWLTTLGVEVNTSVRNIIKGEIDIVLPQYGIGIEYDGLYYHSDNFKTHRYHLDKTQQCAEKGIQLIHVFEHEWLHKQEIVKSIIMSKIGLNVTKVAARKCTIHPLTHAEFTHFLNCNHLQNPVGCKHRLALVNANGEIQAVAGFSKSRFQQNEMELVRYCSKLNTTVIGGLSKIVKAFMAQQHCNTIVSYVDRRYFTGSGYERSGFKHISTSPPNYFYWTGAGKQLFSRQQFQKHKLSKLLPIFDPTLTERENMKNNKYNRIYDCGNLKFQLTLP